MIDWWPVLNTIDYNLFHSLNWTSKSVMGMSRVEFVFFQFALWVVFGIDRDRRVGGWFCIFRGSLRSEARGAGREFAPLVVSFYLSWDQCIFFIWRCRASLVREAFSNITQPHPSSLCGAILPIFYYLLFTVGSCGLLLMLKRNFTLWFLVSTVYLLD